MILLVVGLVAVIVVSSLPSFSAFVLGEETSIDDETT